MNLDEPKEAPRWKRLAAREGIEIDEAAIDRFCALPNLYHPAFYIIQQFRARYPLADFDTIRHFIVHEQCTLFNREQSDSL